MGFPFGNQHPSNLCFFKILSSHIYIFFFIKLTSEVVLLGTKGCTGFTLPQSVVMSFVEIPRCCNLFDTPTVSNLFVIPSGPSWSLLGARGPKL